MNNKHDLVRLVALAYAIFNALSPSERSDMFRAEKADGVKIAAGICRL